MINIQRYMGAVPNLVSIRKNAYEGIDLLDDDVPFDRLVLDLPEPWQVVPHATRVLRSGGMYLSFVPTVPQVSRRWRHWSKRRCLAWSKRLKPSYEPGRFKVAACDPTIVW